MKWINELNDYDNLKHRNAIDLNFIPVGQKLNYQLPKRLNTTTIVDLTASGNTQHQILKTSLQQIVERFDSLAEKAKSATNSYEDKEYANNVTSFQNKMELLSKELF